MGGSGLDQTDDFQKFCGSGLDRIQFYRIRTGPGLKNFTVRSSLNHIQFFVSKDKKTISRIQFSASSKTELEKFSLLSTCSSGN